MPSNWVYGGVFPGGGDKSIIYGSTDGTAAGLTKWVVYSDTVSQYTGLTDKHGTRIFEGDILRGRNEEYRKAYGDPVVAIGEYRENGYVRRYGSDDYDDEDVPVGYGVHLQANGQACGIDSSCTDFFEVIGNRWDNPELMGGGQHE